MQSGQRVYGEINQRIEATRAQAGTQARELQALTADLDRSRAGESAQTQELARLRLEFADGAHYDIQRSQRWRFWRRPLASFVGVA